MVVAIALVAAWRINQDAPMRLVLAVDPTPALRNPTAIRLEPDPTDPAVVWLENQLYTFRLRSTAEVVTVRVDQTTMTLYLVDDVRPTDYGCTAPDAPPTHQRQYHRGNQVRLHVCAPTVDPDRARITLLDGATVGDAYSVTVAAGIPVGPTMPTPTPEPAPTPTPTPHPVTLPAVPRHVIAVYHGGDQESVSVSWAPPPVDEAEATTENPAGAPPAGYRIERRECWSYPGGDYETTEIDPNTNQLVTTTVSLTVPAPPDSQQCGDGLVTQLDPGTPDQYNPEWSPWGVVADATDSAVTFAVDGRGFPPEGDNTYSVRLQYRVAAYNADDSMGGYSDAPHAEATVDRSSNGGTQ